MSLEGSSVLVTGGTRGIGLAIALRLVVTGPRARCSATCGTTGLLPRQLRSSGGGRRARARPRRGVEGAVVAELASHGPYGVVVHNAATGVIRPALETTDHHWDWTLNANARALLALARATAPSMPAGSSIVGISSLGSHRVLANYVLVGTSKLRSRRSSATSASSSRLRSG